MKQFILWASIVLLIVFGSINLFTRKVQKDLSQPIAYPSATAMVTEEKRVPSVSDSQITRSLFVPYWTLTGETSLPESYDTYLYFGVTPKGKQLDTADPGALGVDTFVERVPQGARRILVLRMIDAESNSILLDDEKAQEKIIAETIAFANNHGFDGIALDLELSALPFESIISKINKFTQRFYGEAKKDDRAFSLILYGDVFYRVRPFDVKALSKNADSFMIMAYDFHKARGNPGPNFPLRGKEVYGYDMTEMVDDFLQFIPADKLTVIFGLYGYDWLVDESGKATTQAEALTYTEIQQNFLGDCSENACNTKRKNDSRETEIQYHDEEGKSHIIWFEDLESVKAKQDYLKEQGISSFSFWANSYF